MSAGTPRALVFGGSGQVGAAVLARLASAGWRVDAVSRVRRPDSPGPRWLQGEFSAMPAVESAYDAVVSCGPLDHFADWWDRRGVAAPRVVAFGSTSRHAKLGSADPSERDLATRLAMAEERLFACAAARGGAAIVLRPTLVYGAGRDQTLSRIAALARRRGLFVLPRGATGLRQPVHVDDLATAVLSALQAMDAGGRGYDLPGGETLAYREMVARVLAALQPPPRLLELPSPLFTVLAAALRASGHLQGFSAQAQARLRQDLVFDAAPAAAALGYAPRRFQPDAAMFPPR